MDKILSFDIGGTSIKYGLVDSLGNILWKKEMDTEAYLGGDFIVSKVIDRIREILKTEDVIGIAISTAGIVNTKDGSISETSDTIRGYKGLKLKEILEKEFKLRVTVENDVNCAALGEFFKGVGRNKKSTFCITIGTGVGGAFIVDGRILEGQTFSVGEIGYLNIGGESLDKSGSTRGIVQRVAHRKNIESTEIDGKMIFDLAKNDDQICIEEIDRMVDNISTVISTIAYIVNPESIIIGGGIARQKEYLLPRFTDKIKEKLIPYIYDSLEIDFAELGNDAGMIGAVYNFINKI